MVWEWPNVFGTGVLGPQHVNQAGVRSWSQPWEDVWEELPTEIQDKLTTTHNESSVAESASLFPDDATSPNERKILRLLKADESTHLDQVLELLEAGVSRSEIFAALLEPELGGKSWSLPGRAL